MQGRHSTVNTANGRFDPGLIRQVAGCVVRQWRFSLVTSARLTMDGQTSQMLYCIARRARNILDKPEFMTLAYTRGRRRDRKFWTLRNPVIIITYFKRLKYIKMFKIINTFVFLHKASNTT